MNEIQSIDQAKSFVFYYPENYKDLPNDYKNNKEVLMAVLECDPNQLEFAPDELKDNEEVVMYGTTGVNLIENGSIADYANAYMLDVNRTELINHSFNHASERLRNDREFVLRIVAVDGLMFQYLPYPFKNDQEIILQALSNCTKVFDFADSNLMNDRTFFLKALSYNVNIIDYTELPIDKEMAIKVIEEDTDYLYSTIGEEFKNDKDFILAAINNSTWESSYEEYLNNPYLFASVELQQDKYVALAALKRNMITKEMIPESFKADPDFS